MMSSKLRMATSYSTVTGVGVLSNVVPFRAATATASGSGPIIKAWETSL